MTAPANATQPGTQSQAAQTTTVTPYGALAACAAAFGTGAQPTDGPTACEHVFVWVACAAAA
jgi:hypothetical protein